MFCAPRAVGGLRLAAHIASLAALALAILVAIIVYGMPVDQTLLSASEGAAFGLFPIMYIVFMAIWIYNMTEDTMHFAVLRRSITSISGDQRIQAVLIAFCFGALLEALAGFGTPVAITAVMLIAVGFEPMKAAAVALVANTARRLRRDSRSRSSRSRGSSTSPRRTSGRWSGAGRRSSP